VVYAIALAVDDHLLETEGLDKEPDEATSIARPQAGPDLGGRRDLVHAHILHVRTDDRGAPRP
jgi:hypothetical protein